MPHADLRIYNPSVKGGALGYKPGDLASVSGMWDCTITDLHYIVQIVMGWSDDHLHQFRIHGKRYGIARIGGISFSDDPDAVRLKDLGLRINERFVYEYNFINDWQYQIRVEAIPTPELLYLKTKFASLISYWLTVDIL